MVRSIRLFGLAALALAAVVCALPAGAVDLVDLYSRAQEYDPLLQGARYQWEISQLSQREARARAMPQLGLNGDAAQSYQDIKSSDNSLFSEGESNFFSTSFSLTLTQPIYRADILARIPQARLEARQTAYQLADAEHDLIVRLATSYFEYLAAHDNLEFSVEERRAIQRQLQESEERRAAGLGTVIDVHEARARFALAQADEIGADATMQESIQALAEIVGEVPADMAPLSDAFPLVAPDNPDAEVWVEAALFQNLRIKALQAAVEIAEQEIKLQRSVRRPTLDFVASYRNDDTGGTQFGEGREIGTTDLSLLARIPLYDGGLASAFVRSASLEHKIAMQRLELARRRAERETRRAFTGVVNGIGRVEALRQSVFSSEAALSAMEEGLRAGLSTGLDVLDARRELFDARRELSQARYAYILDSLNLKRATGILGDEDLRQINAYLQ